MIKEGVRKRFTDHRDFDFHKSFGTVGYDANKLPDTYMADAGLTMPDQNADGFPFGCTGYGSTDMCTDQDKVIYDAGEFYLNTPPGGRESGRNMRASMKLLVERGPRDLHGYLGPKRSAFYNIRSTGILDWFDAIRVALWITQDERRTSSIAIPWFTEFGRTGPNGILPDDIIYSWKNASGHNAKIAGWTTTNTKGELIRGGELFFAIKSWQGRGYGDGGWCYMPRAQANVIFEMWYTEAFMVTKRVGAPQQVDLTVVERLVSYILFLLKKTGKAIGSLFYGVAS